MGGTCPGVCSLFCTFCCFWAMWMVAVTGPLVRAPVPYTPTLLPDNFTSYTTYTLLASHVEYSAFQYDERGDVQEVESYQDKTRNSTLSYRYTQDFSGTTCNFHTFSTVTGYQWHDSWYRPQGNSDPVMQAPRCDALVAFRGLLITLIVLPFLSVCLRAPSPFISRAAREHGRYEELYVVIGDGNRRGEGEPAAPNEPPSPSVSSSQHRGPPSYNRPGHTIDMPGAPAAESASPPPAAIGHIILHDDPADMPQPHPQPNPPPVYQPRLNRRQQNQQPRRYIPHFNIEQAVKVFQRETEEVKLAVTASYIGLVCAAVGLGLSVGVLSALAAFVSNGELGESRQAMWGTWLAVSSVGAYVVVVLIECVVVVVTTRSTVRRYLQKEGASLRAVMCC